MEPRFLEIDCAGPAGPHRMVVAEYGDPANRDVVICVHGLTRVSDDFGPLAQALCSRYRVLCPDVAGRGRSEWLRDPTQYQIGQYALDMGAMAHALELPAVHWVGTSMGGLIAMIVGGSLDEEGRPRRPLLRSLVLNDVGAVVLGSALDRIGRYLGVNPFFPTLGLAKAAVESIFAAFGHHTPDEWDLLSRAVLRQMDGGWRFHYDPALAVPFKQGVEANGGHAQDIDLWALYDEIRCPTLLIRGALSDLLSEEVARQMTQRGPRASLVTLEGVGHAPSLLKADQIALVSGFIDQHNSPL